MPKQTPNKYNFSLSDYLPAKSIDIVQDMINSTCLKLCLSSPRKTIQGTYKRASKGKPHIITVNEDLNSYTFLITLLHEFAHLYAWEINRSLRHGMEWKNHFSVLLHRFIEQEVFPEDIKQALLQHMKNIKSSDAKDVNLSRVLQSYDTQKEHSKEVYLMDLDEKSEFVYNNRCFIKKQLLRTYFLCTEIQTKRNYRFHPLAKVLEV
ncbi:MAG: SprT family zinc-dependent metalloprotease [Bacteroidales bacterium]|nr:SprT family zinc-dependent metalloprotease [Bacteroidales bacterium]